MTTGDATGQNISSPRAKLALVVMLAITMAALVLLHVRGVNGPYYWHWTWRCLAAWRVYPPMILAAAPFFLGQWIDSKHQRRGWALVCLSISTFALELACITAQPPYGLHRLVFNVQNSVITSYYTAATFIKGMALSDWLLVYDHFIGQLMIHARFKPPGLIFFYWALMQCFGEGTTTALVAGFIVMIGAALAVPATYLLVRHFTRERDAAFHAAGLMALCPSLILFVPQFDQVYVSMACVLLVLWGLTISTNRLWWALATGLWLTMLIWCTYFFLVLGMFMAVLAMLEVGKHGWRAVPRLAGHSVVILAVVIALHIVAWALFNWNPIETARVIREGEAADLVLLSRPFPYHMPFDVLDVALGMGWIPFLLIMFYLARVRGGVFRVFSQAPAERFAFLAMLQFVTVAGAALLPGESARLWLPLMPLMAGVAGLELARWPARYRNVSYACLLVMVMVICQNMIFLYAGPEIEGVPR